MSDKIRLIQARSDGSERTEMSLEGGDFVHVPSGAIRVIANASETDGGSTEAAGNVWLTKVHDALVASRP